MDDEILFDATSGFISPKQGLDRKSVTNKADESSTITEQLPAKNESQHMRHVKDVMYQEQIAQLTDQLQQMKIAAAEYNTTRVQSVAENSM